MLPNGFRRVIPERANPSVLRRRARIARSPRHLTDRSGSHGRVTAGFPCSRAQPHQALADACDDPEVARAQGGGPRRHRAGRRRAGFRHAREHQGRGDRGDQTRRDEVHEHRGHPGAARGRRAQVQAGEQGRLYAGSVLRRPGRQERHLQRDDGDAERRRRGHRRSTLLGELSRHRAARGRQARGRRDETRGRIPADAGRARSRDHEEHQVDHLQPAVQSDRRLLHARAVEGFDRRARQASAGLDPVGRHVRAPRLRRLQIPHHRRSRAEAVRPHADDERRLQGLLHDGLAHRLLRGAALEPLPNRREHVVPRGDRRIVRVFLAPAAERTNGSSSTSRPIRPAPATRASS